MTSLCSWEKKAGWSAGVCNMLSTGCMLMVVCFSISGMSSGFEQYIILVEKEYAVGH